MTHTYCMTSNCALAEQCARPAPHIGKLLEVFPVHAVLKYPVSEDELRAALQSPG